MLKHVYALTDYKAEEYFLHYLRTKDGLEVDFALVRQENVERIIEVKVSDNTLSKSLIHFKEKYNYPAVQLVQFLRNDYEKNGIQIAEAERFLSGLFVKRLL